VHHLLPSLSGTSCGCVNVGGRGERRSKGEAHGSLLPQYIVGAAYRRTTYNARRNRLGAKSTLEANLGELHQGEVVLRITLPHTRVNKRALLFALGGVCQNSPPLECPRIYGGRHLFRGSGKKGWDCWDNRRAPNKEVDLLDFYTTTLRSKNMKSGYSRGGSDGRTVHRQQYLERLGGGALRRSRGRIQPGNIRVRVGCIRDYGSTRFER